MQLNKTTRLKDIQALFREEYPFLKIEFFDKPHGWGERAGKAHIYPPGFKATTVEKDPVAETITFHPWTRTGTVEEQFRQLFGLYAQIYRRHGYEWIETAGTDELSLDEQNDLGKKSIRQYRENLWIEREILL